MRMRPPGTPSSAFAVPASAVCDQLGVDATAGLGEADAARRLGLDGPNRLRREPRLSRLALVARQFGNSMVLLLVGAAAISVAIGEMLDAGVILAIVVANAAFGAIQEGRADKAAAAVRALLAPTARVLRDGHVRERLADDVVVGDVIALSAGDRVAADGRLVEATLLQVDESTLTGESLPRSKRAEPPDPADAPPAERRTTVLAGTTVVRGVGRFVVTATGVATEIGPDRRRGGPRPLAHTAPGPPRPSGEAADPDRRGHLRDARAARLPPGRHARPQRPRRRVAGGRRAARGPARGGHDHAGPEHAPDGRARSDRAPARSGRDARLDDGDLQRQDRHVDREPARRTAARAGAGCR